MSYRIATRTPPPVGDWTSDAREAMLKSPDYFVWWYTVKSVGLAVAASVAAYYIGKSQAQGVKK